MKHVYTIAPKGRLIHFTEFLSAQYSIRLCLFTLMTLPMLMVSAQSESNTGSAENLNYLNTEKSRSSESQQLIHAKTNRSISEYVEKLNGLAHEVRFLLTNEARYAYYKQNLHELVLANAQQLCPSIALFELIGGNELFVESEGLDKEQLRYAVDLLNLIITELATK